MVVEQVRQEPSLEASAFALMRAIVEGRAASLPEDVETTFHLTKGELKMGHYNGDKPSRAEAYMALGQLGTPEAITYLEELTAEDFSPDEFHTLWPAAQAGLYTARMNQIAGWPAKALFLEETIHEYQNVIGNGYLANWAAEMLCNYGPMTSFPVVQQLLYDRAGHRAAEQAQFCELRMRAVASNPDRVTALASVLQVTDRVPDDQLARWAISELLKLESRRADEALYRFADEIQALPEGSLQREALSSYDSSIRWARERPKPEGQ